MPKVLPLSVIERKKLEFTKWIRGKKAAEKIRQKDVGEAIGVSQQAIGYMMRTGNIKYEDLIVMLKELHATDDEILQIMKL